MRPSCPELHDGHGPSRRTRLLPELLERGVDAVCQLPKSLAFRLVLDDLGAERRSAEGHVRVLAHVVVPGGVLRLAPVRGDDRDPVAIVKVDRGVPPQATTL